MKKLLIIFSILCFCMLSSSNGRSVSHNQGNGLPVRAVNLGGWLVTEGWIKPSLFDGMPNKDLLVCTISIDFYTDLVFVKLNLVMSEHARTCVVYVLGWNWCAVEICDCGEVFVRRNRRWNHHSCQQKQCFWMGNLLRMILIYYYTCLLYTILVLANL